MAKQLIFLDPRIWDIAEVNQLAAKAKADKLAGVQVTSWSNNNTSFTYTINGFPDDILEAVSVYFDTITFQGNTRVRMVQG